MWTGQSRSGWELAGTEKRACTLYVLHSICWLQGGMAVDERSHPSFHQMVTVTSPRVGRKQGTGHAGKGLGWEGLLPRLDGGTVSIDVHLHSDSLYSTVFTLLML